MPTIEFSLKDLNKLVGKNISLDELGEKYILFAKGEIEEIDGEMIKADIKDTNRPDLWSVEGLARELKGHCDIEVGIPKFKIKKSNLVVKVDKKVEDVRPKTVCAVVKNLNLDENSIKQMIQLQEKVCQTFGKNRDMAAIGVYDYDKIKGPIKYTTFKPKELKFKPLGFDKEMSLEEILKIHPKGLEYRHLLKGKKEYPIFIDNNKNVLSMPPIINSDYTGRVDEKTKNVFIEVSGHDIDRISIALNVIVTALRERGGEIFSVDVVYGKEKITTPNLSPKKFKMNINKCKKILGLDLDKKEIVDLLKKSRFDAKIVGNDIYVSYIPYRNDIMDERDLIEEVAISYGYNKINPEKIEINSKGEELPIEIFSNKIREICIGFGIQEILTFTLTNKENLTSKMRKNDKIIELSNPVSLSWSVFRNSLIPNGLEFLSNNKHVQYPQKIFEIGDVLKIDEKKETKTNDVRKLSILLTDSEIGYEKISSILKSFMNAIGVEYDLKEIEDRSFIIGRCASVHVENEVIGVIGEIHPEVLENFDLEKPVIGMELNLNRLMKLSS
ncbi:MAG: phenylalanine--tRNA ligase subunit beta [Candidatus Aenigmarchaeota archaeon]|nr:phenylalanine--tRNA ligase subunit beta [Candidatus Aenigmarchaeota archaeon]